MRLPPARLRAALAAGLYAAGIGLALTSAGCAPTRLADGPVYRTVPAAAPTLRPPPPSTGPGVSSLANLPGWREEDHLAALGAVRSGCPLARSEPMQAVCGRLRDLVAPSDDQARAFLEANFRPVILPGPGLLTAYYAPEYPARQTPDATFSAALRPKPADLAVPPAGDDGRPVAQQIGEDGQSWPYPDRAGIELTPATDALAYLQPEDLFFLQIQGSGVLVFPDGRRMRAAYAADNGRPFVAIAGEMVRRDMLPPDHASGSAIRGWLHAHAGAQAQSLMDLDPRYVFFTLTPDDGREPVGAAGVALTPGRSVAVDPAWHAYGQPLWIDATAPVLTGAVARYRRLVVALDTGSAIRGDVRADLYLGTGERAGIEAGRVRHTLLLVRLDPLAQPSP